MHWRLILPFYYPYEYISMSIAGATNKRASLATRRCYIVLVVVLWLHRLPLLHGDIRSRESHARSRCGFCSGSLNAIPSRDRRSRSTHWTHWTRWHRRTGSIEGRLANATGDVSLQCKRRNERIRRCWGDVLHLSPTNHNYHRRETTCHLTLRPRFLQLRRKFLLWVANHSQFTLRNGESQFLRLLHFIFYP